METLLHQELSVRGLYISKSNENDFVKPRGALAKLSVQEGTPPEKREIFETRIFFDKQSENVFLALCSHGYENLANDVSMPSSSLVSEKVDYIAKVKHTWYISKSLERIEGERSVQLTDDAIESLEKIVVCLNSSNEGKRSADRLIIDFFNTFGSHVPNGPFLIGGRSVERLSTTDIKYFSNKEALMRKLEEEFTTFEADEISASFGSGDSHIVSVDVEGKEDIIEFHRKTHLFGGIQSQDMEFKDWKKGLNASSLVINGAVALQDAIPVWKIVLADDKHFGGSHDKLQQALHDTWHKANISPDTIERESDENTDDYETASEEDDEGDNSSSLNPTEQPQTPDISRPPELFDKLGLTGKVQGFRESLVLRKDVLEDQDIGRDVFWDFVRKISSLDYRGRSCLKLPSEIDSHDHLTDGQNEPDIFDDDCASDSVGNDNNSIISSRDITHAVLHCCDPFFRQELIWKMAECRLAVPILLPSLQHIHKIQFLLFGLRKIYKSWKPRKAKSPVERSVISHPLPIVGFIRFGDVKISKSKLLNKVIGRLQGNNEHPYFVDIEEEPPCAKWSKGTVEAAWFLPENSGDRKGEISFKEAVTFFNLRGDALNEKFGRGREFVCKSADVIVLLVDETLYKSCREEMRKISQEVAKHLVCIVCRGSNDSSTEGQIKRQGNVTRIFSKSFLKDIGEDICKEINRVLWPTDNDETKPSGYKSIESLEALCEELGITVDESNESCLKGKKLASDIIKSVRRDPESYKQTHLPLQEVLWKQWATLDKKWNKGYRLTKEFRTIEHYHDDLNEKMTKIREQQLATKPSNDIVQFIEELRCQSVSCQYFISWLNFFLNDLSQDTLGPLRRKLRDIQDAARELNAVKTKLNDKQENSEEEKQQLADLNEKDKNLLLRAQEVTKKLDDGSLGLEHFLRELGQRYEAYDEVKTQMGTDVDNLIKPDVLPEIAAYLLMSGYPLEILDGDVGRVPIKWVQAVFNVVSARLNNATVCAIAVLGIQSSGKSTLLNSMFGVRFAVSAGRCTRGVFIQLLKIHEDLRQKTNCDYIMLIDTEGLKAPERSFRDDFRHDNELATFALCLADLTIINIAGQTVGKDMTDVLQIAAHAFIRMKEVHIKSSCRIIQQFVADLSAEDKNEACTQGILFSLDEAVAAASKEEGYENLYTRFSDVFNLKRNEEVQYIPSLWQGSMAPPNHRYSEKIFSLKKIIVQDLKASTRTLTQFEERVTNVWNAVKEENFIFSFQNCVVALRYKKFQHVYGKWVGEMRQEIMEWESDAKQKLKSASRDAVDETKKQLKGELRPVIEEACSKVETFILNYLQENMKDDEDQLHKFQDEFLQDLDLTSRTFEQDAQEVLERVAESIKQLNHMDVLLPWCKNQLRVKARKQAVELRSKHSHAKSLETVISDKDIDETFDELWVKWIKEICELYPEKKVTLDQVKSEFGSYVFHQGQKKDLTKGLKKKLGVTRLGKVYGIAKDLISGVNSEIVHRIIDNSLVLLQKDIDNDLAFDSAIIQKCVDYTIDALNQKYQNASLTQDTKINAMVAMYERAVPILFEGRRMYNTKYSLRELLMLEKDNLKKDFRALCSNAFQDQRASENVTSLLVEKLVEVVRNFLGPAIYKTVRQGCPYFASKFALLGYVLEDIAVKEDFKSYYKFIFELESFLEEWSLGRIADVCTKETMGGTSYVYQLASDKLGDISRELLRSIRRTVEIMTENNCAKFSDWIMYLRIELQKNLPSLYLSEEDVENLYMFEIEDLKFFGELVIDRVQDGSMVRQILTNLNLPMKGDVIRAEVFLRSLPTRPHHQIKRHVSGCMEQCPICHVPCDNMTKQHEKHRAELHYPEGVVGCAAARDNRLTCNICTSSVTSGDSYWDGQKKRNYCDYQTDFPSWVIQPIQNDTPLKYWKWVLNRFNEDFARLYDRSEAQLPLGWIEITKEQALQDLREAYVTKQVAQT